MIEVIILPPKRKYFDRIELGFSLLRHEVRKTCAESLRHWNNDFEVTSFSPNSFLLPALPRDFLANSSASPCEKVLAVFWYSTGIQFCMLFFFVKIETQLYFQ